MELRNVFGISCARSAQLAIHPHNPWIAYSAGACVVVYNYYEDKQSFFVEKREHEDTNKRTNSFSCLCFSPDGNFLAVGETDQNPRILVWDLTTRNVQSVLIGHKFGVLSCAFSPDCQFLVSLGVQHDGNIFLWKWREPEILARAHSKAKINAISYSSCGKFFVTAGYRHIKFWTVRNDSPLLESTSALLGEHKSCDFRDVSTDSGNTYAITSSGLLVFINSDHILEKWVALKMIEGGALDLDQNAILCAGSDGVIRLFEKDSLKYISTFPQPKTLQSSSQRKSASAVKLNGHMKRACCIFEDRSMFLFDYALVKEVRIVRNFSFHSKQVISGITSKFNQANSHQFLTSSEDNTIQIWDLERGMLTKTISQPQPVIAMQETHEYLVTGDAIGNISVFSSLQHIAEIEAHDGDVSSLHLHNGLLSSASSDRLVHIFNTNDGFELLISIEHDSPVEFFKFIGNSSVSNTSDRRLIFRDKDFNILSSMVLKHAVTDYQSNNEHLILTQDLELHQFGIDGSLIRTWTSEDINSPILKFDIHQNGTYVVCALENQYIKLFNLETSELIASLHGNSKKITCIKFWDQGIVSADDEGHVFVWLCDLQINQTSENQDQASGQLFDLSFIGKLPVWARPRPSGTEAHSPLKKVPTDGPWIHRLGIDKTISLFSEEDSISHLAKLPSINLPRRYSSESIYSESSKSKESTQQTPKNRLDEYSRRQSLSQKHFESGKALSLENLNPPSDYGDAVFHSSAELLADEDNDLDQGQNEQNHENIPVPKDLEETGYDVNVTSDQPQLADQSLEPNTKNLDPRLEVERLRKRLASLGINLKTQQESSKDSESEPQKISNEHNSVEISSIQKEFNDLVNKTCDDIYSIFESQIDGSNQNDADVTVDIPNDLTSESMDLLHLFSKRLIESLRSKSRIVKSN